MLNAARRRLSFLLGRGERGPLVSEDFRRAHPELSQRLDAIRALAGKRGARDGGDSGIDRLLQELSDLVAQRWTQAQDAVNLMARTQVAQGIAHRFLERRNPYTEHPQLAAMVEDGLLDRRTFIQKPPSMLGLYRWLLRGLDDSPRAILEIGVKGGGSTAFWKALFPSATVVGLDLRLRGLAPGLSADGVVYVEGDQADEKLLRKLAVAHGPFDLVIDDGSHVAEHQAASLRGLLSSVRPGGYYVVEDIQRSARLTDAEGGDLWSDFTLTVLQRLRRGTVPAAETPGVQLALEMVSRIDDLVVAHQALAIRVRKAGTRDAGSGGESGT